jgi:signal transduction histidine kinase
VIQQSSEGAPVAFAATGGRGQAAEMPYSQKSREHFLNVVVHDLRTPLTSVKGYAQLALRRLDRGQYDGVRTSLLVIDREVNKMARMLQNTLEAGRLESGRTSLRPTGFDLASLVADVVESVERGSERTITCVQLERGIQGVWDRERLGTAISNVLDNAVAYSEAGSPISVTLRRVVGDDGHAQAELAVTDQGLGVAPEEQELIFESFTRGSNSVGVEGMGLGLYLTRRILGLHSGTAMVVSAGEGQGATFTLRLPIAQTASLPAGG